jgi:error-prone DNA polymerase
VIREEFVEIGSLPDITLTDWQRKRDLRNHENKVMKANGAVIKESQPAARREAAALLHVQSAYTFGRSSLNAADIAHSPSAKRYQACLLADTFSLAGAHEFVHTCREMRVKPLVGATLEMPEGGHLVLVARTQRGFRNLSRLITACHLEEPRLFPLATWERVEQHVRELICLTGGHDGLLNRLLIKGRPAEAEKLLDRLVSLYGRAHVFIQIERSFQPWEITVNRQLLQLADQFGLIPVAGGPVRHAGPEHFRIQDILVCIDTLCAIEDVVGRKPLRHLSQPQATEPPVRGLNAERYLRTPHELHQLFADQPDLVANTLRVANMCDDHVLPERAYLPLCGEDENERLRTEVFKGSKGLSRPRDRHAAIESELGHILSRGFAAHFLIAWDMCQWARSQGILFSGRGSVVDSVVAYSLGLSRVDSLEHGLNFHRFLPDDGSKRPDIDIDFEAARREDVRQFLADKYGRDHVATIAAVGTYRSRGIIREVGKVMGIPQPSLDYLTKRLHGSVSGTTLEKAIASKPELRNSDIPVERFRWVFELAEGMKDLTRNLRAHSSGVVISRDPIRDTVPVVYSGADNVLITQWDKGSSKHYFDKFDILCLRGNDVLSNTEKRVQAHLPEFDVQALEVEDEEAFRAMRAGHLIGVPQSASPAMRQAHMRVKTACFHDAGIVQAAIRPGVGGAVKINEFIARKHGLKPVPSIHPDMDAILKATYGIIVFQEQVDKLLTVFAGYSHGEAEEKREAIYKKRKEAYVITIRNEIIGRILERKYDLKTAEYVYDLVSQFQGYGFAEGHALAFADISIRSIHCQQNYPVPYFSALLDAQPAGYYPACTIVNEARSRGVKVLGPCINHSGLKYAVEDCKSEGMTVPGGALRVALPEIKNVSKGTREKIVSERENRSYRSFFDFVARVHPARDELESLILCGAFDGLHPNRRALLWSIPKALKYASPKSAPTLDLDLPEPSLPQGVTDFSEMEKAVYDRQFLELDVEKHLMAFERERVQAKGVITAIEAGRLPSGARAHVVGNPIRLRFPPTSSGKRVMFFDLEDESGLLNVTCFDDTYQRDGHTVITSKYITIYGEAQNRDGHTAFLARRIYPYKALLEDENLVQNQPVNIPTADFLMS